MAGEKRTEAYDLSLFEENAEMQMSSAGKKSRKKKKAARSSVSARVLPLRHNAGKEIPLPLLP